MKTYEQWKESANDAAFRITGLTLDDLPDVPLADWFEDGLTPTQAARRAIRYANGDE
jgi:hypothetical protein